MEFGVAIGRIAASCPAFDARHAPDRARGPAPPRSPAPWNFRERRLGPRPFLFRPVPVFLRVPGRALHGLLRDGRESLAARIHGRANVRDQAAAGQGQRNRENRAAREQPPGRTAATVGSTHAVSRVNRDDLSPNRPERPARPRPCMDGNAGPARALVSSTGNDAQGTGHAKIGTGLAPRAATGTGPGDEG